MLLIPHLIKLLFLVYLLSFVISCVRVINMHPHIKDNKDHIDIKETPPHGPKKAVVIVLHGLNLKPEKMHDWASLLSFHGAHVISLSLYGHQQYEHDVANITADIWRIQMDKAISLAQKEADNLPIYGLGFSLGGLIALDALTRHHNLWQKMVLIAPALSTPWYSKAAIKALAIFGRGFIIPSRSPKTYRANKGTSIAAYEALFALLDNINAHGYHNTNIDTLIFIDEHDELINTKEIRKLIWEYKLSHWQLHIVNNHHAYKNYGFRHLMVDKEAMGEDLWQKISHQVLSYLLLIP